MKMYTVMLILSVVAMSAAHPVSRESRDYNNINIYMSGAEKIISQIKTPDAAPPKPVVAFSVGRTGGIPMSTFKPTNSAGERIPMDTIMVNHGGHFNMTTSVFDVPITGIYVFHYSAGSDPDFVTHIYMMAGPANDQKTVGVTFNNAKAAYNFATGSVMVSLNRGDTASLWTKQGASLYGRGVPRTQFYGYLLAATEEEP